MNTAFPVHIKNVRHWPSLMRPRGGTVVSITIYLLHAASISTAGRHQPKSTVAAAHPVVDVNVFDHAAWCSQLSTLISSTKNARNDRTRAGLHTKAAAFVSKRLSNSPQDDVWLWLNHGCSSAVWRDFVNAQPWPTCNVGDGAFTACPGARACVNNPSMPPHIAIMMASTTRGVAQPSPANMALFTLALPSIAKTVECGFRYTVYVGYDAGDAFYDTARGNDTLHAWFGDRIQVPLKKRGIDIRLKAVRVDNPIQKPGPIFNAVARHATHDGVDFYYRVNDDTLMVTPWPSAMVCALCSMGPPYGVVGPLANIRTDLLEHDFVHRTHVRVFGDYYPPELVDWWMDDWMTRVYGRGRSLVLVDVKTLHFINVHGRRYDVNKQNEEHLMPLLRRGRQNVRHYVQTNTNATAHAMFSGDAFEYAAAA